MCPAFRVFACTNIAHTRSSPMNHRYFTNPAIPICIRYFNTAILSLYYHYVIFHTPVSPYRRTGIAIPVSRIGDILITREQCQEPLGWQWRWRKRCGHGASSTFLVGTLHRRHPQKTPPLRSASRSATTTVAGFVLLSS